MYYDNVLRDKDNDSEFHAEWERQNTAIRLDPFCGVDVCVCVQQVKEDERVYGSLGWHVDSALRASMTPLTNRLNKLLYEHHAALVAQPTKLAALWILFQTNRVCQAIYLFNNK